MTSRLYRVTRRAVKQVGFASPSRTLENLAVPLRLHNQTISLCTPIMLEHFRTFSASPTASNHGATAGLTAMTPFELARREFPTIKTLLSQPRQDGALVVVRGWVRTVRTHGSFSFVEVTDGTTNSTVQVVVETPRACEKSIIDAQKATMGSSVVVRGVWARNPKQNESSLSSHEVAASLFSIVGFASTQPTTIKLEPSSSTASTRDDPSEPGASTTSTGSPSTLNTGKLTTEALTPSSSPGDHSITFSGYPLQKKSASLEYLRTVPQHKLRTNTYSTMMRIRAESTKAFHDFFYENGFLAIHPPIITALDCEGAGEMFEVTTPSDPVKVENANKNPVTENQNYRINEIAEQKAALTPNSVKKDAHFFGSRAYLSVSGQLYAEIGASSASKVYSFGPTFRAENSHTTRHLAEFWMLEPEIAFADLAQVCDWTERSIKYTLSRLLERNASDLQFFDDRYSKGHVNFIKSIVNKPFARLTYTEAYNILSKAKRNKQAKFKNPLVWGEGLHSDHERYLADVHVGGPVFVTNYPSLIKPFYMYIDDDEAVNEWGQRTQTVACMDLLVPKMGELCGGSQREDRTDILLQRMVKAGLDPEQYKWYAELRVHGSVPHGGWGMGFERFLAFATGMENVRDTVLVPRAPKLLPI